MQSFTCLCILAVVVVAIDVNEDVVVKTNYGYVRGHVTSQTRRFLGIPYAQPPVGNMRWRSPARPSPWGPEVYNATETRPACPQKYCSKFLPKGCPNITSEDCLFLNIWTPLNASLSTSYPVMFWIHGGAFKFNYANAEVYDGNNMSYTGQVVVVTVDYRLGLLGFLYTGEGPDDSHGNYGIQDQRAALEWVLENILYFGGDPAKVTIFGQSAGAQSVYAHVMSPLSAGMFRAAIVESSPFAIPYRTKQDARKLAETVGRLIRCDLGDMACFRATSVDKISDAQEDSFFRLTTDNFLEYFEPFGPVIDGYDIPMQPMMAANKGAFYNIPMLIGTVSEEGRMFVYGALNITMPRAIYDAGVLALHPKRAAEVEKIYYVPDNTTDYRDAFCQIVTDFLFTCATRNVTKAILDKNDHNLFRYVFNHATVARGGWGRDTFCEGHVCHAEELDYVFDNPQQLARTEEESRLSTMLLSFWTNFAHTLDPNSGPNGVDLNWPIYLSGKTSLMYFQTPKSQTVDDFRGEWCDFWDNIGY